MENGYQPRRINWSITEMITDSVQKTERNCFGYCSVLVSRIRMIGGEYISPWVRASTGFVSCSFDFRSVMRTCPRTRTRRGILLALLESFLFCFSHSKPIGFGLEKTRRENRHRSIENERKAVAEAEIEEKRKQETERKRKNNISSLCRFLVDVIPFTSNFMNTSQMKFYSLLKTQCSEWTFNWVSTFFPKSRVSIPSRAPSRLLCEYARFSALDLLSSSFSSNMKLYFFLFIGLLVLIQAYSSQARLTPSLSESTRVKR